MNLYYFNCSKLQEYEECFIFMLRKKSPGCKLIYEFKITPKYLTQYRCNYLTRSSVRNPLKLRRQYLIILN